MKIISKYILVIAVLFAGLASANAQKFGHLNSNELLNQHPEVLAANSELETLQKQLGDRIQKKLELLQSKVNVLREKEAKGELSPKQIQDEAELLRTEEMDLQQQEQVMQQQLIDKRKQLIEPILEKVQSAIDAVAEEGGYQYIFDAGLGVLLYYRDSDDVTSLIKAKLGL
jgi:outer membrane protein